MVRATVHREGDMWVIEVDGWGATQAHQLSEVDRMARDYVASLADVDPADVEVTGLPAHDWSEQ